MSIYLFARNKIARPVYYGALAVGRGLLWAYVQLMQTLLGKRRFLNLCHAFGRQIDKSIVVNGIIFDAVNARPMQRGLTHIDVEPDTISWLEMFVNEDDVLYDIGANIGIYTLYAAIKRGAVVRAFEPMSANYDTLNRNIYLNNLSDRVLAFNLAMHSSQQVSVLNLSGVDSGKAGHGFHIAQGGSGKTPFEPEFRQGVLGLRLDGFVNGYDQPFPNHVKIDVDGNEPEIIAGMEGILGDKRLKTIAVELEVENFKEDAKAVETIKKYGFELLTDPRLENSSQQSWTKVRNYFFARTD
tara:strand:- start:7529 stop:8422 length:894 start_codon:yes stop_codon:yes gene_type:complete